MRQFLSSSLDVPDSNILVLTNNDATREKILSCFDSHLIRNENIQRNDPIIFFFAGHGSRVDAPPEWATSDGKTGAICPYDEGVRHNGDWICAIPARTLNGLFRQLAGKRGNNIVCSSPRSSLH